MTRRQRFLYLASHARRPAGRGPEAIRLPGSGFRRFRKEDVQRMRQEMWSQFAPDTPMPSKPKRPSKRTPLTDEDYDA